MTLVDAAISHQKIADPFAPGKLVRGVHDKLVIEIRRFATEAGISYKDITGHEHYLQKLETDFLLNYSQHLRDGSYHIV